MSFLSQISALNANLYALYGLFLSNGLLLLSIKLLLLTQRLSKYLFEQATALSQTYPFNKSFFRDDNSVFNGLFLWNEFLFKKLPFKRAPSSMSDCGDFKYGTVMINQKRSGSFV